MRTAACPMLQAGREANIAASYPKTALECALPLTTGVRELERLSSVTQTAAPLPQ